MLNKQVNFQISTMKKLSDLAHEKLIYINGGYGGSVKTETHLQREFSTYIGLHSSIKIMLLMFLN